MVYTAITIEGGLFPSDLLDRVATGEGPGQAPKDFGLDSGRLSDEIQSAFSDIHAYWDAFQRRLAHSRESATTITRESWVTPLLERLGFTLEYQRAGAVIGGEVFPISHRAGDDPGAPPVHIVAIGQSLDRKEGARRSPHALVQEYLNRSDALWGIVTNGERLRLLRDSARLSRPTYLEFDLRGMIEGNLYSEFVLFYRLLHRTRFPQGAADAQACVLERLYQAGIDAGGRVREKLREGVEQALEILGQAFLSHPDSAELREAIASGRLDAAGYYRQLLRLIYRLLFLFVAEERRLIFPPEDAPSPLPGLDEGPGARAGIYYRYYSVSRLRERCERPFAADRFADLWQGLLMTFRLFREHDAARHLGIEPLDGELFGPAACRDLEGAGCENAALLRAIFHLSTFLDEGEEGAGHRRSRRTSKAIRRRVNYAALDVEELGSVYESLLDLQPALTPSSFRLVAGTERKTTGSYYTPPELVNELIESALVPVIEERLRTAKTPAERESALLSIRVCDPASGSGHFLLAAARRLGRELAKVRTGEAEPAPGAYRHAVRDVIRQCVYAVDKNPLAVDLCKVALWIEGHEPGAPLSFLDHHVKCGDSLAGVFDLSVLPQGIPDEAYKPVTGDDQKLAAHLKKLNKRPSLDYAGEILETPPDFSRDFGALALLDERTAGDVQTKEKLYRQLRDLETVWWTWRRACNLWTAAFFAPIVQNAPRRFSGSLAPLTEDVHRALAQPKALDGEVAGQAEALAERLRFFHWPLEFPEVFEPQAAGFDVVLGNPPWERVKLQEQEFFATRDPDIAQAPNKAARERMIRKLRQRNPALFDAFRNAQHDAEATSKFLRGSGRFPLTGRGDINTYSVFAELAARLIRPRGRAGVIVPTGIATDDTNKHVFGWLVEHGRLVSLFDFENREGIFPSVHRSYKFSLVTMTGAGNARSFAAAFFLLRPEELREPERRFTLTSKEIALLNPNTRTCPVFRTARDAEITKRIYHAAPVLVREGPPEINPWGVTFKRMFDMSNDSYLFRTRAELEQAGYVLGADGRFRGHGEVWLPLYEAKMIHQFDHRFATYEGGPTEDRTREVTPAEHADPAFVPLPRYWVDEREVERAVGCRRAAHPGWFLGFRDITNATNERTAIFSLLPWAGVGHTASLIILRAASSLVAAALGNFNSLAFDYAVRQKMGGTHLSFGIVKQLPVLPPETYTPALLEEIVPRVLELVYTAHDLAPFAGACGYDGPPFRWDEERRAQLRAELDGIYAHLYGLSREDFAYILDTFPIVRRKDEERFGEYRTKRLCLAAYDRFAGIAEEAGGKSRLSSRGGLKRVRRLPVTGAARLSSRAGLKTRAHAGQPPEGG